MRLLVNEIEQDVYDRKMERWAEEYPLAAVMMFSKKTFKGKVKFAEARHGKQSK